MRVQCRPAGYAFWIWWVLVNTISVFIGMLFGFTGLGETFLALVVFGITCGGIIGITQWLVLRLYIKQVSWWILATSLGWTIGWIVIDVIINNYSRIIVDDWSTFIAFIVTFGVTLGFIIGLMQWMVLKRLVAKSIWWIIGSILSNVVSSSIGFYVAHLLSKDVKDPMVGLPIFWLSFFAVFGSIYAISTGTLLTWLLGQSKEKAV
ncbi:MAG: hypothetical protein GY808_09490 [Gammaproteobacteria bacterium]|nr:hypothetical protein [Gammaproteobacteria bacterium]MCP4990196.1 hypothetical protein [Colwellia sp.]